MTCRAAGGLPCSSDTVWPMLLMFIWLLCAVGCYTILAVFSFLCIAPECRPYPPRHMWQMLILCPVLSTVLVCAGSDSMHCRSAAVALAVRRQPTKGSCKDLQPACVMKDKCPAWL